MDTNKPIRINKFLSSLGTYSRRQVDKLIEEKRIKVNKKYAKLGIRVSTNDEITIDGELILIKSKKKKPVYLILNKPIGIECTTNLNVNNNIIDFLGYPKRIFPVGRLDKDSEGIIFLTNDGDIVNKILRSENNNEKEYEVRVNKKINSDFLNQMSGGVKIKNVTTKPCKIEKINNYTFKIILTQGLNRQIRKMCRHFNYKVKNLKRTRIINISLGSLKIGKFRKFTPYELESLMDHL
tara:strand:+ start:2222 stop:2935 length:714 start_codon:yes stop_codon:yes gene_type:complete